MKNYLKKRIIAYELFDLGKIVLCQFEIAEQAAEIFSKYSLVNWRKTVELYLGDSVGSKTGENFMECSIPKILSDVWCPPICFHIFANVRLLCIQKNFIFPAWRQVWIFGLKNIDVQFWRQDCIRHLYFFPSSFPRLLASFDVLLFAPNQDLKLFGSTSCCPQIFCPRYSTKAPSLL